MISIHLANRLVSFDGCADITPGSQVQLSRGDGLGIVVALADDKATVLWSQIPDVIKAAAALHVPADYLT